MRSISRQYLPSAIKDYLMIITFFPTFLLPSDGNNQKPPLRFSFCPSHIKASCSRRIAIVNERLKELNEQINRLEREALRLQKASPSTPGINNYCFAQRKHLLEKADQLREEAQYLNIKTTKFRTQEIRFLERRNPMPAPSEEEKSQDNSSVDQKAPDTIVTKP